MASPFKFFRKYSGGMMIIMVILSMLLFTLTDLFMDPSANLWLLGILIGGAVFGIAGIGQGRWLQWGLGGALLGAALGFILPGFVGSSGLSTSLGVIDEDEMQELEVRRYAANQFVSRAMEESFGEGTARFATLFGFGHQSVREDVIFGKLLRAEADRLGITVDDAMVSDYLSKTMNDKLTKEGYVAARNAIAFKGGQLDDDTLISVLSDEIKARLAFLTLAPRTTALPPGPEVYWQYFRKLNVRQQLNLAAVDVDAFVDEVEEPTDAEVSELFAKYATKRPNQEDRGSPGFRLPFRAKLAYIEVDAKSVEKEVGEVTDEQIQKYYDDNKETPLIKRPVIPDFDDGGAKKDDEAKEADEASKDDAPKKDAAADQSTSEKPDAGPKADETSSDKPDADKPDEKKSAEEKPAEPADKPEVTPESPAEPEAKEPEAANEETPEPAETPEPTSTQESGDDSCGPFESDEEAEGTDTNAAEKSPADEPSSDAKATDEQAKPSVEGESSSDKPSDAGEKPGDDKPADDKPPGLTIPDTPIITPGESKMADIPETEYEYRELDEELKSEIRDEILRQRVQEAIDAKLVKAKAQMETIARDRSKERFSRIEENSGSFEGTDEEKQEAMRELRDEMQPYHDKLNDRLKNYAKENGLTYVETPMISYAELIEEEDYPIGSATEPEDNPMLAAQSPQVARTIFQSFSNDEQNNAAQLYNVREAVLRTLNLDGGEHHYVYWATDFSPSHVPTLDEPRVRDTVVLEWKRDKSRELAKARAKELAEQVRSGLAKEGEDKQDMASALEETTVTGDKDGTELAVRKTMPFSWLRTSSASPMNFQPQQATLSPIQFEDIVGGMLERVDERFMEAAFDDMNDEEVSVIPNVDLSTYYVVHVTNRFPTPEIGEDGLRERFAKEGEQFAFARSPMLGVMEQQIAGPARLAWERDLWVKYGVNPDDEPEQ